MAFNKRAGGFMWKARRSPSANASFRETDAWLLERGWSTEDKREWRSIHRGRVTIATHAEAVKIQQRRDRAIKRASKPCRRCSECPAADHHWIDNDECESETDATHACKHCDALGDECEACDGDGGMESPDGHPLPLCPGCKGHGVVERASAPTKGER